MFNYYLSTPTPFSPFYCRFMPQALVFPSISAFYVGTNTGYFGYVGSGSAYLQKLAPSQALFLGEYSNGTSCLLPNSQTCVLDYKRVDTNGNIGEPLYVAGYNHRARYWWKAAEDFYNSTLYSAGKAIWTKPFIFSSPTVDLGVTLAIPFSVCASCTGFIDTGSICAPCIGRNASSVMSGVLCADYNLNTLEAELSSYFPTNQRVVFMVDRLTQNLMGSSISTPVANNVSIGTSWTLKFIPAVETASILISSVSQFLTKNEWTPRLYVFNDQYVQLIDFSTLPGISWWVVIVMPAEKGDDFIPSSSIIAKTIYIMTALVITMALALIGLNYRLREVCCYCNESVIFLLLIDQLFCFFLDRSR